MRLEVERRRARRDWSGRMAPRSHGRPSPGATQHGPAMPDRAEPRAKSPIRLVVADDHELFREGLRLSLARSSDLEVVGEGGDGSEAVALTKRLRPDILLLDDAMPDLDGLAVTLAIRAAVPRTRTRIVILTGSDDQRRAGLLLRM